MKFDLQKFNNEFKKRIILLFILFVIANIFANLPSLNIFVDILSHFKVQYFYISILFTLCFLYFSFFNKKFTIGLLISFIILIFNYLEISKYCIKPDTDLKSDIKIVLFNVLTSNKKYDKLINEIYLKSPDVVILQEVNKAWLKNIESIKTIYPYFVDCPRDDNFGLSLYSKYPLSNAVAEYWTDRYVPIIRAQIKKDETLVTIYCVHTLPPVNNEYILTRNNMLLKINNILHKASKDGENIIIAGDFNTTIFSPAYKKIIDPPFNSNITIYDAIRYLPKIEGTWNAYHLPVFRITLEHILSIPPVVPVKTGLGHKIGSDHFPVFAEFAIAK